MTGLSSQQATNWWEGRRLRAWELSQEGWPQQRIAEALGVSKGAVSQWLSRTRTQVDEPSHDARMETRSAVSASATSFGEKVI